MVFQNHSLLPWLTCFENVYLAVERVFEKNESGQQMRARTTAALELVGLAHATDKRPNEISGGMKQRVGIARALAMQPKVLLLDEPFGALDVLTRANLQDEPMGIMAKSGCTAVMVTHDVDEAALLSDHIVMMTNGPAASVGEILRWISRVRTSGWSWLKTRITTICVARCCAFSTSVTPKPHKNQTKKARTRRAKKIRHS